MKLLLNCCNGIYFRTCMYLSCCWLYVWSYVCFIGCVELYWTGGITDRNIMLCHYIIFPQFWVVTKYTGASRYNFEFSLHSLQGGLALEEPPHLSSKVPIKDKISTVSENSWLYMVTYSCPKSGKSIINFTYIGGSGGINLILFTV